LNASLLDNHDNSPASSTSAHPSRSERGLRNFNARSGIGAASANREAKLTASSMAADEIAYGSGQGLKVLYATETSEDFDRQIMEVR